MTTTTANAIMGDTLTQALNNPKELNKNLSASGAEITDDNELLIKDPKKNLAARIKTIQALATVLKDKNVVGERKEEAKTNFENAIEQYIFVAAACINNNLITTDDTGILKADAKNKYFKGSVGHVNAIAKKVLAKQEGIAAHEGALLSETALAQLIETPYDYRPEVAAEDTTVYDENNIAQVDSAPEANGDSVVEITCTDGSKVTIDKNDSSMYVEAQNTDGKWVIFKRKVVCKTFTWYETARIIAVSFLGFVWDLVKSVGIFAGSLVTGTLGTITGSTVALGSNIGYAGKSFFGKLKSAHTKAKEAALDKGIFI